MKKSKTISELRMKIGHRLMTYWLDKKLDDRFFTAILFQVYKLIMQGAYVNNYQDPSRHHYIPKFLLRKFKLSSGDLINEYSHFKEPEPVSIPKRAAYKEDLYAFTDKTKRKSDFIEKSLFGLGLEHYSSRIINEILKTNELNPTNLERSILALYIAFQYVRTPAFLHHIRIVLEYLHLSKKVPVEEMKREDFYRKAFFENYYEIKPPEPGKFALENKLKMTGVENLISRIFVSIGSELSGLIYSREFCMLEAREPAFFYLSDNPANIFNPKYMRSVASFLWEMKDNPLIYIPISPSRCLYFVHTKTTPNPTVIGKLLEVAIPESVYEFAYSDRISDRIKSAFKPI